MRSRLIDTLRSMYVRWPRPLRGAVSPFLAGIPSAMKYGGTYRELRRQIAISEVDAPFVRDHQEKMFRRLLMKAKGKSPHFQQIMKERGIDPGGSERSSLEWLLHFPVLRKAELRADARRFLTVPSNVLDQISTSGSSGRPLSFYLDRDRSVKEWAFIHHVWSRSGYRHSDKRAVLRGTHIRHVDEKPWEYDAPLRELRLSPFHLTPDNLRAFLVEIQRRQIRFLHGYPSALFALAAQSRAQEWPWRYRLMGIFPISESLYSGQREILRRAFPKAMIVPFYGLSEKVAFGGECSGRDDVYEFEPLYGITELLDDDDRPVTTVGARGRIVSTGLLNLGMPLIRYDTEDDAVLVRAAAADNQFRLQVSGLRSRWSQEFVVGRDDERISVAALNIHSEAYQSISEFQFFQSEKGLVDIRVVPRPGATRTELERFVREISDKVGASTRFMLRIVDDLDRNSRGKVKLVEKPLDAQRPSRTD